MSPTYPIRIDCKSWDHYWVSWPDGTYQAFRICDNSEINNRIHRFRKNWFTQRYPAPHTLKITYYKLAPFMRYYESRKRTNPI